MIIYKKKFSFFAFVFVSLNSILQGAAPVEENTYITLRSPGSSNIEFIGWHELLANQNKKIEGTHIQISGFYGSLNNHVDLGGAFLRRGHNTFAMTVNEPSTDAEDGRHYVYNGATITDNTTIPPTKTGRDSISADCIQITPSQERYGVQFNILQNLNPYFPGFYAGFNATIAQVSNSVNLLVLNQNSAVNGLTVTDYFNGKQGPSCTIASSESATAYTGAQKALLYSKLDNTKHTKLGACNTELFLGYTCITTDDQYLGIHGAIAFPTDSKSTCTFLFEPRVGWQFWGTGVGINYTKTLFKKPNQTLSIAANLEYRYFFTEVEKRTLDLLNYANTAEPDFGRYALFTTVGAAANTDLFPAANVLTRNFYVTPGSRLEGTVLLNYNLYGASFNIGYNLYFKDAEMGSLKDMWPENTYGLPSVDYDITLALNTANTDDFQNLNPIYNNSMININAALSDSQLTHKFFIGVGFTETKNRFPCSFNIGGAYEIADNRRSAAQGFEGWAKVGLSF